MTKRLALDYVNDVYEALCKCLEFTRDMDYNQFQQDTKTVFAVIRALEIIGEGVKKIPDNWKAEYQNVPWKEIAGMRDVLIHHYFGVDYAVVWQTVKKDVPLILPEIEKMKKVFEEQ